LFVIILIGIIQDRLMVLLDKKVFKFKCINKTIILAS
jgi:hypothetical protein